MIRNRNRALDILRGVAIILVLFRHLPKYPDLEATPIGVVVAKITQIGWSGVDLFFVLSGFLISNILYKEFQETGKLNVLRFWIRRAFKIWPSYFAAYGLKEFCQFVSNFSHSRSAQLREMAGNILPNVFFVQNYCLDDSHQWTSSWSLAIEEHFYLILPPLLLLANKIDKGKRFQGLLPCAVLLCVAILAGRIWSAFNGETWQRLYRLTHCRADALAFGVILGYLAFYKPDVFMRIERRRKLLVGFFLAVLVLLAAFPIETNASISTVGFTLVYLAYGGLVVIAASNPDLGRNGRRTVAWLCSILSLIGVYSYTIYLVQAIIYNTPGLCLLRGATIAVLSCAFSPSWSDRIAFILLSLLGGILLSHLIERPFLRLRKRLYSSAPE